ncbi:MAG: aminofutalosine synthase MqnE, partial [Bacteroidetes bacterium]|nr:aminofutalosine synthase MqnE [Bacteroidota bacterium]
MRTATISSILADKNLHSDFQNIANKVVNKERITSQEGLRLFDAELSYLGALANHIRQERHGDITYFNRNIHIEPTNICVFDCKFCAYSR